MGKDNLLFPEQSKERKTLFENSIVAEFSVFRKQFEEAQYSNIDIYYYYVSVRDWSLTADKKRTAKGWIATARQFMRSDNEKGKLKLINKNDVSLQKAKDFLNL